MPRCIERTYLGIRQGACARCDTYISASRGGAPNRFPPHRCRRKGRVAVMRYRLTFVAGLALGYVLGTRAGRERYEQLKKSAREVAQNPAVRNTAETAAQQGREFAGKAYHAVSEKVGDHVPDSVAERVRSLRERNTNGTGEDDWGTSNT
ncbi:hypothetical protein GCM10011579_017210 [Streptomyces albiflavescens]|uniref:YtxH domain-containing protein n=2 Tax=Streptomyces albiflavescens TaxID=1623582 RepID=A0A918D1E8_9ACTN|nr:hypothetical protein GCM10011579_017210 [Streptomyces albiflavescens]